MWYSLSLWVCNWYDVIFFIVSYWSITVISIGLVQEQVNSISLFDFSKLLTLLTVTYIWTTVTWQDHHISGISPASKVNFYSRPNYPNCQQSWLGKAHLNTTPGQPVIYMCIPFTQPTLLMQPHCQCTYINTAHSLLAMPIANGFDVLCCIGMSKWATPV